MRSEQESSKDNARQPNSSQAADSLLQRLQNITDHLPGVIFRYHLAPDGKDYLEYVSQGSEKIWGISAESAMNDNQQIWARYDPRDLPAHRASIAQSAENLSFWSHEWRFHHPDGRLRWHRGQGQAHALPDGGIVWDSLIIDITEQKALELRLEKIYALARIGTWELELTTGTLSWSKITREIHEIADPDFAPDLEKALNFYLPADQVRHQEALEQCMRNGQAWDMEAQIKTAQGNVRWVRSLGKGEMEEGQCRRLLGSFTDIHAQKTAEIERENKTKLLAQLATINQALLLEKSTILESIGDGFVTLDRDYVVTYWNQQAEALTQTPRSAVINQYVWDVFGDVIEDFKPHYDRAMQEQVPVHFESYYPPLNCWFDVSVYPSTVGLSVYFRDITERFEYVQAIEAQNESFREINWMQSHVVRSPLARIMGLIQLIEIEFPAEDTREHLQEVLNSAHELDAIIQQIVKKAEVMQVSPKAR